MDPFYYLNLTSNLGFLVGENEAGSFDSGLLQAYVAAGGGPVPGQPGWFFTIEQQEVGTFFAITRADRPGVMLSLAGIARETPGANVMWELLEGAHLKMYEMLAKAWKHNIPDNLLGNPSQPHMLPWVGTVVFSMWLAEYPDTAEWLGDFEKSLTAAILNGYN